MKIAVLGWGSLLWDRQALQLASEFAPTGPNLPIEFCRVSKNRRLTLVIDERYGTLCETYVALSALTDLPAAIQDLATREAMSGTAEIGFVTVSSQDRSAAATRNHPHAQESIADWALNAGCDAVIWTALPSQFEAETGEPFSVTAAMRFLEDLRQNDREAFERAMQYIRRAPPATQTPVRDAVTAAWPE